MLYRKMLFTELYTSLLDTGQSRQLKFRMKKINFGKFLDEGGGGGLGEGVGGRKKEGGEGLFF